MASIYSLKPKFQRMLRPLVNTLASAGVSANQITIAALTLSLGAGSLLAWSRRGSALLLLPPVLLARMALNAMDGMLAREHNQQSATGAVLNEMGDVVSDVGLYLPLALIPGFGIWPMAGVVILSVLSEMTGMVGVSIGGSRRYDGPLGKSDRAMVFGVLGLLVGIGVHIERAIPAVLFAMNILLALTVANRMRRTLLEASSLGSAQ